MAQSPRPGPGVLISPAIFPRDKEITAKLFVAYAEALPVDLSFQNFTDEVLQLPGKYADTSRGALYLAYKTSNSTASTTPSDPACTSSISASTAETTQIGDCIGCVGLREFEEGVCELKRLYVTPEARGLSAGRILLEKSIERARELGFKAMVLDTLGYMVEARRLYARYGFVETGKYYENPNADVVFYRKTL